MPELGGDLDVVGKIVNPNISNIKFTTGWSDFPNSGADRSEISNDTGEFKKLMIVGNKSRGGDREVGIWDNLTVSGNITSDKIYNNWRACDGHDLFNYQTSNLTDCMGTCKQKGAYIASREKSTNTCYCKQDCGFMRNADTNWETAHFFPTSMRLNT